MALLDDVPNRERRHFDMHMGHSEEINRHLPGTVGDTNNNKSWEASDAV